MHLDSFNTITSDGSKYIITTFIINTRKPIHIVCVYKAHSCSISTFLNSLQTIIQQYPKHCPIIIMGDFNVDILKDNNQTNIYIYFVNKFQLKSQFNENTTKARSQLDHIWANALGNECKFGVTKTYWSNFHKPTYIAFKLPTHFQYITKTPLMSSFI